MSCHRPADRPGSTVGLEGATGSADVVAPVTPRHYRPLDLTSRRLDLLSIGESHRAHEFAVACHQGVVPREVISRAIGRIDALLVAKPAR